MTPEARSRLMARIRARDTKPEMKVRSTAHRLGYRFRLYRKDLPGSPDLVFSGRGKLIYVHGCFWHRHPGCRKASTPATRQEFWEAKFTANVERDIRKEVQAMALGWEVIVIWECETRDTEFLEQILCDFLGPVASVRPDTAITPVRA